MFVGCIEPSIRLVHRRSASVGQDCTLGIVSNRDHDWSFTDCTSKVIIERLQILEAFAFDHHFDQFGTVTRVPRSTWS